MSLLPHLIGVLREGALDVVVSFGVPFEVGSEGDRKAIAHTAENSVRRMTVAALAGQKEPEFRAVPLVTENR
jgi:1-acyl-sn-glycerol-3-phosphate acyltransferase